MGDREVIATLPFAGRVWTHSANVTHVACGRCSENRHPMHLACPASLMANSRSAFDTATLPYGALCAHSRGRSRQCASAQFRGVPIKACVAGPRLATVFHKKARREKGGQRLVSAHQADTISSVRAFRTRKLPVGCHWLLVSQCRVPIRQYRRAGGGIGAFHTRSRNGYWYECSTAARLILRG